ncbi:MAG: hypothetical protein EOR60_27215 [Mesorhizobium sp.]|nr:MAG: hypothetical protein EOR60_27215 [Mesorhizobium sp.]
MRNATVSALIYEFLFDFYRQIEIERGYNLWLPDEHGVEHETFYHMHTSCWEWSTGVLEEVGAIKFLQMPPAIFPHLKPHSSRKSPYSYPLMTLEECRVADFSEFESFDNYCHAMFTFEQLMGQTSGLAGWSPRFLKAVASEDDIFLFEGNRCVAFDGDRFKEKVMTRWAEMQVRIFRRKDASVGK